MTRSLKESGPIGGLNNVSGGNNTPRMLKVKFKKGTVSKFEAKKYVIERTERKAKGGI